MTLSADPPVQLRQFLTVAKRQGHPFGEAWSWAFSRVKWEHNTGHRRESKEIMTVMRWAFEAGYHDEDVPGGPGLVLLMELLAEEVHDPSPKREPPMVITGKQHRHALDFMSAKAS